jgi:predicted phosphodiesterase
MKIALFADIHGKVLLPFKLVDLYQRTTGHKIDLILQCGDIGAFFDLENLDKATIKHAKYDRDELGFYDDFVVENTTIRTFLDQLGVDMICVRGNHEEQEQLDVLETTYIHSSRFPIDVYRRVWVCKTGVEQYFENTKGEQLSFVGVGRIGDRKNRTDSRFIQPYEKQEIQRLVKKNPSVDILLTHDKEHDSARGYGMAEIRSILDNLLVRYHFYGHTGEPYSTELDENGITYSTKIKELEFDRNGILPIGCMLILNKIDEDTFELEVVSQQLTNQLAKHNWKY